MTHNKTTALPGDGFTFTFDDILVEDDHQGDDTPTVTVNPATMVADNSYPGTVFTLSEPLFEGNPNSTVLMGPGVLVENFRVLDAFTAMADVTVSARVLPTGHHAILDTDGGPIRMGDYAIECGELECVDLQDSNAAPTGQITLSVGQNQQLGGAMNFADQNGDIVQAEVAVEELASEEVLLTSPFRTYATDDGGNRIDLVVEGLPPGEYLAIGIIHDGLVEPQVVTEEFKVTAFPTGKPSVKGGAPDESVPTMCAVVWNERLTGLIPCQP